MLTVQKPGNKTTTLIVLLAFVRDDDGEHQVAFEPRDIQSEEKARMDADRMSALGTYAMVSS